MVTGTPKNFTILAMADLTHTWQTEPLTGRWMLTQVILVLPQVVLVSFRSEVLGSMRWSLFPCLVVATLTPAFSHYFSGSTTAIPISIFLSTASSSRPALELNLRRTLFLSVNPPSLMTHLILM